MLSPPVTSMRILYVEPFESGSHAGFGRALQAHLDAQWTSCTLPGRHWKWHMRAAAAHLALAHPEALAAPHDLLLASSYVPLAELVGLAPALATIPRVLYFHENQLAFPTRTPEHAERDLHFGVTQMISALAASACVFNSDHNRTSFLAAAGDLLRRMPALALPGWIETIAARSQVLPVPLELDDVAPRCEPPSDSERALGPLVVWNHRWEHDKNPAAFLAVLRRLCARDIPLRVAICGQRFSRIPPELAEAPAMLGARLVHFGELPERGDYLALLGRAHVAVSTAIHEFYGVAMLEATHLGALPLVPARLSYPELFGADACYRDDDDLAARLEHAAREFVAGRDPLRRDRREITRPLLAANVVGRYAALFGALVAPARC